MYYKLRMPYLENLVDLFESLRFDVKLHNDVTFETMEKLLLTMHLVDHSNYDAFVCCILTHGKLDVVYTSDEKPLLILQITEFFSEKNCLTLNGKPKMFFIQACQKGESIMNRGVRESWIMHLLGGAMLMTAQGSVAGYPEKTEKVRTIVQK